MKELQALFLICDNEWLVWDALTMVHNEVGTEQEMLKKAFKGIIHEHSHGDVDHFIDRMASRTAFPGVELKIHFSGGETSMLFMGSKVDDSYVIGAGVDIEDVLAMLVHPAVRQDLRRNTLVHGMISSLLVPQKTRNSDDTFFDDISRLNNEIVNTNRELAKRNFQIFLEKEMNRVTLASIGEAVVATDVQGKITVMNATAEHLTGWSSQDAIGRYVAEVVQFVSGADDQTLRHLLERSLRESVSSTLPGDAVLVRRDGNRLPIDESIAPIRDSFGRTNGLVIMFRDTTESRRAEKALQESEERFREIFNHANDGIEVHEWTVGGTPGKFVDVNEIACRMLGYTREELFMMRPTDISTSHHNPPIEKVLESLRTEGRARFETEHRRKDGSIVPVEINDHVVDMQGRKVAIAVVRDISERKQLEKALRLASTKLGILNSITRHDILNQMTMLTGYLELLKQRENDSESALYLDRMSRAANTVQRQISFTEDYQDMGVKAPAWIPIGRQALDAFAMLHPLGVKIEDKTGGVEVMTDRLVEKVLYNLIDNSIRHGEHVSHIEINAEQSGDALIIVYQDDGVGIKTEYRRHLFDKGYGKNTGLGLFLVREILAITGITIEETGLAGHGVRFELVVPAGAWRRPQGGAK